MYNQYTTSRPIGQEVELEFIPYLWDSDTYGDVVLPTAPEKKSGQNKKNWQLTEERKERFHEAAFLLLGLVENEDIPSREVSKIYNTFYPDVIPYPVRGSPQQESYSAWKAFNKTSRPASRLFAELDRPHLYTLHAEHLDLDPKYADSSNFPLGSYDTELRQAWKLALKAAFGKAARFIKFEQAERFHCHGVMEHDAGLLHIPRGGEIIKPVEPGTELKLMGYLYKQHATNTDEHLAQWIHAKRIFGAEGKHLPKCCNYYNLPAIENSEIRNRSVLRKDATKEIHTTEVLDIETGSYVEYTEDIEEGKNDNNLW